MRKQSRFKNEEVNKLIVLVVAGDSDSFTKLVDQYNPVLKKILNAYTTEEMSKEDVEDLSQEELIAFYRAIINFDKEQTDVEFGLYAKICITNSMISYKRAAAKKSNESLIGDEEMKENFNIEERKMEYLPKEEKVTLKGMVKILFDNKQLLVMAVVVFLYSLGSAILNAFGQNFYYRNSVQTDYEKLEECFRDIATKYSGKHIALPWKIGCGLAGGDWDKVQNMIYRIIAIEGECKVTLVEWADAPI